MELAVIRHTRLDIETGRCYGQSEIALADTHDAEFEDLRTRLPGPFDRVFSSPLERCTRLADRFANAVETDARLLEYDFGDWEMQRWDDIAGTALDAWMQDFVNVPAPGGENLVQMHARVQHFIDDLRTQDHRHCLIVTHSGVIRCIWACLLGIPLGEVFKLSVGYGEVLRCQIDADPQRDLIFPAT